VIRHRVCAASSSTDIFFMAQRSTTYFSDGYAPRGLALAERRLAYLVELYDSGRWRRYHGDADFLLIVREAKAAVEGWRRLLRTSPADAATSAVAIAGGDAALVPQIVGGAHDPAPAPTSRLEGNRSDAVAEWRARGTWLPPVAFLADDILAEGDLAEA
jgi:uncharacterized repeat protein (TIGR03809 family)